MKIKFFKRLRRALRRRFCRHEWDWNNGVRICKKCLAIDIPETLRAIEIQHPGKRTETDRPSVYFDTRGCVVSTVPEHLNPMNKEDDGNR